jgi:SAM-dependent methyltransferase
VTRFYRSLLEPSRICVADLQEDAVDFQRRTLGVEGFVSRVDPNDLDVARRFDAVFATSLFTHLPAGLFEAWLRFLLRLLRPGGILMFSTVDRALHGGGVAPGDAGLVFERRSESRVLSPESYGTTWVSEPWLRARLGELAPDASWERVEDGLCNQQDLWIVSSQPGDSPRLAFRAQPVFACDDATYAHGRLALRGWVLRRHGCRITELRFSLDDELLGRVAADRERPDIAASHGPEHRYSGWELQCKLAEPGLGAVAPLQRFILVEGLCESGERTAIWCGRLYGALLACREGQLRWCHRAIDEARRAGGSGAPLRIGASPAQGQELRAALREAEDEIARMKASRFWKLRDAWWKLRGLARR